MNDLISRQAAIDALFDWEMTYDWDDHCREEDPKPAYIVSPSDVIERLPSAQPEPCEDAVSRSWLFAEYDRQHQGPPGGARKIIEIAPSVTPKQRTGKWIDGIIPNDSGGLPVIVCDQCNTFFPLQFGDGHNFCPNCGAKMTEGVAE